MKRTEITPELRQTFIEALVDGVIGLKECGCVLQTIEGVPATPSEQDNWNEYVVVNNEKRNLIREGLAAGFIDLDALFDL